VIVAPAKVTTPSPSNKAPLASAVVTLVENEPLSVFKSDTRVEKEPLAVTKSFIEPLPSNKFTLVLKLALDSVIEPEPSNKLTLVLKLALDSVIEPEPSKRLTRVLMEAETSVKSELPISEIITLPNEPVEKTEPLINVPEPLRFKFKSVTRVEKEPLSVCNASTLPSSVVSLVLMEDDTLVKSEFPISATIILPNEPVDVALPLTVPVLSTVKVCGEEILSEPNEPVVIAEPLMSPLAVKLPVRLKSSVNEIPAESPPAD